MEQKFSNNSIDLQVLREFCEREGEAVSYRKGDQMEREGDPSRWFGYVTDGCFKYVTHGISVSRGFRSRASLWATIPTASTGVRPRPLSRR